MQNLLNKPGRFGDPALLATVTDPASFVQALITNGFTLNGQLTAILSRYIPEPAALTGAERHAWPSTTRTSGSTWARTASMNPHKYDGHRRGLMAFDPKVATTELTTKIVQPTLDAGKVFDSFPYLTRLYTTLSPADMNKDPVFSYNPSLPDYSQHPQGDADVSLRRLFRQNRYGTRRWRPPAASDADSRRRCEREQVDRAAGAVSASKSRR